MFGRRSNEPSPPKRVTLQSPAPQAPMAPAEPQAASQPRQQQAAAAPPRPEPIVETQRKHSEEYYDVKTTVFNALIDTIDLTQLAKLDSIAAREEIRDIVSEIVQIKNVVMSISEQEELLEDICNDVLGYGPLEPLLARDDIADIMVNGANTTFIEVGGKVQKTGVRFADNQQLMNICQRIVSQVGRRVDEVESDMRCAPSRRVARQRHRAAARYRRAGADHPEIQEGSPEARAAREIRLDHAASEAVLEIIGRVRCNVIISGGTGSGKTTLLNCLTGSIDDDERIITCEDSAELQLQQPHVVRLETRPPNLEGEGEIRMRDLIKNCLRMRPERIIVGEVRGPEAFDLLQAMNTGHDGSMGTLHANSPREALSRLESMIMQGGYALPIKTIREMICGSVDVIVQASRLRDGSRKITHITEVLGMEEETVTLQNLLVYEITGEDEDGKLLGRHRSTGIARPRFWERAEYYNETERLSRALLESEIEDNNGNPLGDRNV